MASELPTTTSNPPPGGVVRIGDQAIQSLIAYAIQAVQGAIVLEHANAATIIPVQGGIVVEAQFAVQYGAPIEKIVQQVADRIRTTIEYATGITVVDIKIHIAGTRNR